MQACGLRTRSSRQIAAPPPCFPLVAFNNTVQRLHRHQPQKKRLSALGLRTWSRHRRYIMSAPAEMSENQRRRCNLCSRCFWWQIGRKKRWDRRLLSFLVFETFISCKITLTNFNNSMKRTRFWPDLSTLAIALTLIWGERVSVAVWLLTPATAGLQTMSPHFALCHTKIHLLSSPLNSEPGDIVREWARFHKFLQPLLLQPL